MSDYTLGDTLYFNFTTRAFATGIPTVLAGTPVISIYEDNSVTQITAGITLIVSLDSVVGLNNVAVVATGGNGFETGKFYSMVITTGTVGGVSVVGEVVGSFSLEASAAAQDLANGTDGLGAIKTDTAATLIDTAEIGTAGAGLTNINLPNQTMDIVGNITGNLSGSVGSLTGHTVQTGDNFARLGAPAGASIAADLVVIDNFVDGIETAVITNAAGVDIAADIIALKAETVLIVADTNELQGDWVNGGRLDLILDARSSQSSVDTIDGIVDNILVDTAEIGTAGAGLSDITLNAASIDLVWDEVLTGATHNIVNSSGRRLREVAGEIFAEGTAQAGGNNTIQLASGDVTTNDQFRRSKVITIGGTGTGQEAIITSSVASTDTLTVTPAWLTNPDATTEYQIMPAQVHSTVRNGGYDNGFVYVDTVNGVAGTEKGVNGTSTNPSSNLTDAYVIAGNEMITDFQIIAGSTVTLPSDSSSLTFSGGTYAIALNGQEIGDTTFNGAASITGVGINTAGGDPFFNLCGIGSVTLTSSGFFQCGFFGTFTVGTAGAFTIGGSASILGLGLTIDYGSALNTSTFDIQNWGGGDVEIQNAGAGTGTYVFNMNGFGDLTINANCSATTNVDLHGNIVLTNNASGITVTDTANISQTQTDIAALDTKLGTPAGADMSTDIAAIDTVVDAVLVDTAEIGTAGAGLTDLGGMSTGMQAEVNAEVDTALSDYDGPTNAEMELRTPTAAQLAYIVANANTGLPVTFTTSGGSTTAAVLNLVDGSSGSAVDDQYNGRLLVFTDGTLKGVVTDITDYDGGTTTATITAIPTAPTASHNARLI